MLYPGLFPSDGPSDSPGFIAAKEFKDDRQCHLPAPAHGATQPRTARREFEYVEVAPAV